MGEQLKPCPFCGGEAERFTIEEAGPDFGGDVICCQSCGASSHVEFGFKENLEDAWNHRTNSPRAVSLEQMADALEGILVNIPHLYEARRDFDKPNGVSAWEEWEQAENDARAALSAFRKESES